MNQVILIVDPLQPSADGASALLDGPYDVLVVRSCEECLALLPQVGPDLVLIEFRDNAPDGLSACRGVKESPLGEFTPVLVIGTDPSESSRIEAYRAGADDFLARPFPAEELLAKVRVHFRSRRALSDLWMANERIRQFNDELEGVVAQRTADVLATRDMAVFALAKLAESRDPETGAHLERMQEYCQIIAEELSRNSPYTARLGAKFLQDLYHSSPLHDVGKVAIPDAILLKPTRLTPEEFSVMRRHAELGAAALSQASRHSRCGTFLDMAVDIARHHHERFDGRGYPDGLRGEDIPLSARIVALGDVFDAMTSWRAYKHAIPPDDARREILSESGRHFDPHIVAAFDRRFDDIHAIWDVYQSESFGAPPQRDDIAADRLCEANR